VTEISIYKKTLQRERAARKEAERLLELKSHELFFANESLKKLNEQLKAKIKHTAFELEKQQQKYYNIVHAAQDIIFTASVDGVFLYVNPAVNEILGFTVEEIIGDHYLSRVHPLHRNEVQAFYEKQVTEKIKTTYLEFPVVSKQNKVVWLGQKLELISYDRQSAELIAVARDITKMRQNEEELIQLSATLHQKADFLTSINEFAVSIMDKHTTDEVVWEVTQKLIKNLGFEDCIIYLFDDTKTHLVQRAAYGNKNPNGRTIKDPIVITVGDGITGSVAKSGKAALIPDTSKDPRYIIDDKIRYSELAVPIIADGEVIGVIDSEHSEKNFYNEEHLEFVTTIAGLISNKIKNTMLLERQRDAEAKLAMAGEEIQKSEEKYRSIIENMNLGLMEVDLEGYILHPYQIFCEMTGYAAKEIIGKKVNDIFLPEEYKDYMVQQDIERLSGRSNVYEIEMLRKNGDRFWVMISGSPIYDIKGELVGSIGIHLDITYQKQLQKDLEKARIEAEKARDYEKEFLANMSHEIRNPINSVIGMANLFYDTPLNTEQLEYVDNIKYSADILLALVSDILDISKITEGKMELAPKVFSLRETINGLERSFDFKLKGKKLKFKVTYDNQIPDNVFGDNTFLNQILLNILSNAIKFTEYGEIHMEVKLLEIHKAIVRIQFVISDTGIGIESEKLEHIFDRFSQAGKVTKHKYGGTGLGLPITKQLVDLMKGSISVTSEFGHGTVFTIMLPFERTFRESTGTDSFHLHPGKIRGANILIVEDNEINRLYLEKILDKLGIQHMACENGKEAVELLENNLFELILMDIRMPEMDGYETTIWLRSHEHNPNSNIPIIALTASALLDEKQKALDAGMDFHLTKPFTPDQLVQALQTIGIQKTINDDSDQLLKLSNDLDRKSLEELYQEDWYHASMMFELFLKNTPEIMNSLEVHANDQRWESALALIHKVKSNFHMVGLGELSEQAENIEINITEGSYNNKQLKDDVMEFIQSVQRKVPAIEAGLTSINVYLKKV
jgi:PAS domain S-box-containing protein